MPTLRPDTVAQFRPLADLVPDHWTTGSTVAGDGTSLHWTDTGGDGPPVVLLHGVQVDGLSWLRTAQALEADHRVVMPDLRGHGRSGRIDAPVPPQITVDDMVTVLAAAGVDEPIVIGHSMGADVAGRLAAQHAVRGLVLVDPALRQMPAPMFDVDDPPPWMAEVFDTLRALPALLLVTARPMFPGADIETDVTAFTKHWRDGRHVHVADSGHAIPADQFDRFIEVVTGFIAALKS